MLSMDVHQAKKYLDGRGQRGVTDLAEMAKTVRRSDLAMINRANLGHIGGDFSSATRSPRNFRARPAAPSW